MLSRFMASAGSERMMEQNRRVLLEMRRLAAVPGDAPGAGKLGGGPRNGR